MTTSNKPMDLCFTVFSFEGFDRHSGKQHSGQFCRKIATFFNHLTQGNCDK